MPRAARDGAGGRHATWFDGLSQPCIGESPESHHTWRHTCIREIPVELCSAARTLRAGGRPDPHFWKRGWSAAGDSCRCVCRRRATELDRSDCADPRGGVAAVSRRCVHARPVPRRYRLVFDGRCSRRRWWVIKRRTDCRCRPVDGATGGTRQRTAAGAGCAAEGDGQPACLCHAARVSQRVGFLRSTRFESRARGLSCARAGGHRGEGKERPIRRAEREDQGRSHRQSKEREEDAAKTARAMDGRRRCRPRGRHCRGPRVLFQWCHVESGGQRNHDRRARHDYRHSQQAPGRDHECRQQVDWRRRSQP